MIQSGAAVTSSCGDSLLICPPHYRMQEGEAFLESKGMKVTDDVAKTRAQKEKLDEISTADQEDKPPRMPRDGTMVVTAKVNITLAPGLYT